MTTKHTVRIEKNSLKKLTIFNDRAELKRSFTVNLKGGLNEVVFENVSNSIYDGTERVSGSGDAVIEEVKAGGRTVVVGDADNERAAFLRESKQEYETAIKTCEIVEANLKKKLDALDKMMDEIGNGIAAPKGAKFTADSETLDSITTFFAFYDEQTIKLRSDLHGKAEEKERLGQEKQKIEDELSKIDNQQYMRYISVILNAKNEGPVELELTYQVWGAHWYPFYDVRAETKDDGAELNLTYYAHISQESGEDWEVDSVILSTAEPSFVSTYGSNVPELGTLDVSIFVEPPPVLSAYRPTEQVCETVCFGRAMGGAVGKADMKHRMATVTHKALISEFVVERACSIPSDAQQHKFTIGEAKLSPTLVHECVPSKNPAVFLTASALNDSDLPILSGNASIFIDGAYITNTHVKQTSPGERISISLGTVPSVRVEYKPVHKYKEQKGVVNKLSSVMHEQKVVVRNTRKDAILLTIKDQIPRSTDERIKIQLVAPEAVVVTEEESVKDVGSTPTPGVKLMPNGHVDWTLAMEPGDAQTLTLKYMIEHPAKETILTEEVYIFI